MSLLLPTTRWRRRRTGRSRQAQCEPDEKSRWKGDGGWGFTRKVNMLMVKEGEIESHDGTRDQSSFLLVFC